MAKEAPATGTQAGLGRSSDPCWPSKVTAARADQPFASGRPVDPGLAAVTVHHQDRWLVVVNKPAGLLTQPGLGPEQRDSLVLRLQARWPELRLVHRLDRDTSGLLLLARDSESHRQLSRAFAERQIQKRYFARVLGSPEAASGTIDLPIMKLSHQPPLYGGGGVRAAEPDALATPSAARPWPGAAAAADHRSLASAAGASAGDRPSDPRGSPLRPAPGGQPLHAPLSACLRVGVPPSSHGGMALVRFAGTLSVARGRNLAALRR